MAASPEPLTFTFPLSSTLATPSLFELYLTQRVTSAVLLSEYRAVTFNCVSAPIASVALAGSTCSEITSLSFEDGGGVPAAIHSEMMRYSSEFGLNRRPPPCALCIVGLR